VVSDIFYLSANKWNDFKGFQFRTKLNQSDDNDNIHDIYITYVPPAKWKSWLLYWMQTADTDVFLLSLFFCGCPWILQQVCCFIVFLLDNSFKFDLCFFCICIFCVCVILNCAGEMLLMCSVLQVTAPHPPSVHLFFPGSQLYHSALCIFVQFLMLRLMGRTVTSVLSSFTFQMVRYLWLSLLSCLVADLFVFAHFCRYSVVPVTSSNAQSCLFY